MKLALWTYEGPPHVGAMRVATAMEGLHYVLHAPQGDTYADLLFTMIERRGHRPPVTYTTFQARDLGADTADLFREACQAAYERHRPEALIVGASCTAELIQDDPGGLAEALGLPIPVIPLELPSYQRREHFGADETFYRIVRALAAPMERTERVSCNVLGPTALGFRHRDDAEEVVALLESAGVNVGVVAPMGARPADVARLGAAHFNVLLYPETAESAARHLEKACGQPYTRTVPIGAHATRAFLAEVEALAGRPVAADESRLRLPWWSASVDSNYLTGKRVFVFGDATHAAGIARVAAREIGYDVCGLGCYNREGARTVRAVAREHGAEAVVTDDHLEVEAAVERLQPELILGTQMERHIAKRLGVACAVVSAPAHVHDYPARHSPPDGPRGRQRPLRHDDPAPRDGLGGPPPAHVLPGPRVRPRARRRGVRGHACPRRGVRGAAPPGPGPEAQPRDAVTWLADAERELRRVPFFVRGKARRNTETYAAERGVAEIGLETLYEAKAHYAR